MNDFSFLICATLLILGLCLGSFACAFVWRLRARQLKEDKAAGEKIDEEEYKKLKGLCDTSVKKDRSRCLNCSYKLHWYDMIPVFSWLALGGRCRKCRQPIGLAEPLSEIGLATFFVTSYIFWPTSLIGGIEIAQFILWLIAGVVLTILFVYDLKWFLLPTILNYVLVALGVAYSALAILASGDKFGTLISILVSAMILSGIYMLIYLASHKRWIGLGDIILGLGLALLLVNWTAAYIALFAANFIGCLVVIPGMVRGKLKRDSHVPFGPLLIIGFWIAGLFGSRIIAALLQGAF